jgi:hypothetical protein
MTLPAGYAEPSDSPVLHDAIALAPQIRTARDEVFTQEAVGRAETMLTAAYYCDDSVKGSHVPSSSCSREIGPFGLRHNQDVP